MVAPLPASMPTLAPRNLRRSPARRRSTKVKILVAVLGSLLLHGILLLVLGWVVPHWPHAKLPHGTPPPIHLTFTQSPKAPAPAAPATGNRPEYMRTLDEQKADHAPDQPNFISDKDTLAASELPATGDKPLPSQDGRNVPTLEFDTRPNRDGKVAQDAASAAPVAPPPQNQPQPTPEAKKPAPHTKALHPPKPPSTPNPAGELASVKADAPPPPEPPTPNETPDEASAPPPVPRQSQNVSTNPSVNSRGLPHPPGYQPQTIKTKASGGISNRGLSAVAAAGTPLGRYEKEMEDAIGMLWYQLVDQHMDVLAPGDVKLHFYINRQGKVEKLRVTSGKPNSVLADLSVEAVSEAPLPPIPPEVADILEGGQLEVDNFGFEFLTNP